EVNGPILQVLQDRGEVVRGDLVRRADEDDVLARDCREDLLYRSGAERLTTYLNLVLVLELQSSGQQPSVGDPFAVEVIRRFEDDCEQSGIVWHRRHLRVIVLR